MFFTDVFIKRKVLSLALTLAIFLAGLLAYKAMPMRQFPVVDLPIITIKTEFPGASPKIMSSYITTPIYNNLSGIRDLNYIQAKNSLGSSTITIWLNSAKHVDVILAQITSKVNAVQWRLPHGVIGPAVAITTKGTPVLFLTLSSKTASVGALSDYIKRAIKPLLVSIQGVKGLRVFGGDYTMRIRLDPRKLTAHKITTSDVKKALLANNIQTPMGKLQGPIKEFNISSNSSLKNEDEFNNLIIQQRGDQLIRIKDIGYAKLETQEAVIASHIDTKDNAKSAIMVAVIPEQTANNIALANKILTLLPQIQSKLSSNMKLSVFWNTAVFSTKAVNLVYTAIWQSVLCVIFVIFIFLGSFRSLIVPITTIPFSIIGACSIMYGLGFSLNTFTLLAFVLAIGLVVDDAIVILENIHRHMEKRKNSTVAAIDATREIAVPIIAMTLVVACVFIPIALVTGVTGKLFEEFGLTLSLTVLLSGLCSLILSPMMSSVLLNNAKPSKFALKVDQICFKVEKAYKHLLKIIIHHKFHMGAVYALIFSTLLYLLHIVPSELIPNENQGAVLGIGITPTYSSDKHLDKLALQIRDVFRTVKEAENIGVVRGFTGPLGINSFMVLRPHQKGDRTESEIIASLREPLAAIPDMMAFPINRPPLTDVTGLSAPVQFVLQSYGSYDDLFKTMNQLIALARKNPNIINISSDLRIHKPEIKVDINRDKAGRLGIPIKEITDTFEMYYARPKIAWFNLRGQSYPIIPEILAKYEVYPYQMESVDVKTKAGDFIPLSELIRYRTITVPESLNQFQGLRSATLRAYLMPEYTLGQALDFLQVAAKKVMSNDMKYDFALTSREYIKSQGAMGVIFSMAIFCIFLMLSIKFNSFAEPLVILLSVPLAVTGALFALHLFHYSLNIFTQIGIVMLIGLISKHGILIVSFANELRDDRGLSREESVIEAASIRLRPILMTTGAMVFGAVPLALTTGEGSISVKQIGLVIISGLSFGSILTLFILPCFYCLLARRSKKELSHQDPDTEKVLPQNE
jgi:multidrug efflux pump